VNQKGPTGLLEREHRVIQRVIGTMVTLAGTLERGGYVEVGTLIDTLEFMRAFADQCHHGKEERHLFPLLGRKGAPVTGYPLDALIRDHENTRTLTRQLAGASEAYLQGNLAAREALLESLRGLIGIYPNHMWKEDYLLFPMANRVLSPKQQRDLREKFEAVDAQIGTDAYQRFEQMANRLEGQG